MTPQSTVLAEYLDDIAVIRLHRPAAMNAVNASLRTALTDTLYALEANETIRAIVLTGSGERAFCAGQDLEEAGTINTGNLADWLNRQHAMYQAIRDMSKPIVAALNATAVGAGFQMALMCDLRVAHPALRMGQPEVRAGLASIVGSYLMSLQIGHSLNQELSLTGELITGERAHALGLVNDLVAADQVLPRALERAAALAALPRTAFRLTKQRFRESTQAGFDQACNAGIRYQLECYASGEPQQVMQTFISRRTSSNPAHPHKD
ncbi:enoyl-CoA hydratase/isomerase family protein [Advenella mimigardefordensis]|uniref:Putative enoyl-CoA hydratase/isomerase n=1 Tax=Advenella mimigardefordensis (strain DSM 17166 / LMG 22922 / DPN7) TaxID=1247726 RepID=W0PHY6_ADVMD|nr:enoyl-CoA hydratase/isomerase family protein [Advenella mimigardefordensis]AHG64553.1 putative enoyl-CoA hydratase/isomerase [Advenella mimigardefordensis DPN7]